MIELCSVAIGGYFGSVTRFYISVKLQKHIVGTWLANITGSMLLAVLLKLFLLNFISDPVWYLLGVGFSGAYTTFSTFGYETVQLLLQKKYRLAIHYVVHSFTISILLVVFILNL